MSRNGVWQLQKLVIKYCDLSGSSRDLRNVINTTLKEFKINNPQIEFEESLNRGKHPLAIATYKSGVTKTVPLRGRSEEKILKHIQNLRDTTGEAPRKFGNRYIQTTQSIQGLWNPFIEFSDK